MQHIRLTCGECKKRYRLPIAATGYFRCRNCDLIMPIPDMGTVVLGPPEDLDDSISEIGFDPNSNEPIHLQTSDNDDSPEEPEVVDETVFGSHVKEPVKASASDIAIMWVGVGLALSGMFVLWLQLSQELVADRSILAAALGLVVAILGAAAIGYGLRERAKFGLAAAFSFAIVSVVMFGVLLTASPDNDLVDDSRKKGIDPASLEPSTSPFALEDFRESKKTNPVSDTTPKEEAATSDLESPETAQPTESAKPAEPK